ncbi:enolase C-terminal domain-like protein [Luteolibacter sp. Populi]|uniref:enolase C-terminal domain-like protein n=1 Tax=Luteolibacter sp. Populi TaxID=3230487 RepID=UPI003465AB38
MPITDLTTSSGTLIWYWHYRLKSRRNLNSRSSRKEFEGVLLKDSEGGHACLHPWPELGDPSLQKCLEDLAGPRSRSIVRRALRCLEMDGAARSVEDALFEELEVPASHATLVAANAEEVTRAVDAGFGVAKLKSGAYIEKEGDLLVAMAKAHPALRWRLDFNESGEAEELAAWLKRLPEDIRSRIEFLEDPCEYSESTWGKLHRETRIALAVDRESSPQSAAAQVMVIKPALDEPWLLAEAAQEMGQRVVVTSYMDHPLGQAFAAWEAGRLALQFPGLVGVCGLQTHHLFETDAFTEALGPWTPAFHAPPGTGLGFNDLLDKLPWKRLA